MNDAGWMEKAGATKGKLALVAVLAVVLVIVVAGQLGGGSTTADVKRPGATSESPATPGRVAVVQPSQESSPASAVANDAPAWPDLSLEDIVRHDPLAVPAWFQTVVPDNDPTEAEERAFAEERLAAAAAAEAERQQRNAIVLEELRQQGAQIVVLAGNDKVAAIGERWVRVGDRIEQFEITDITRGGVVLSEIRQP